MSDLPTVFSPLAMLVPRALGQRMAVVHPDPRQPTSQQPHKPQQHPRYLPDSPVALAATIHA